MNQLDYNQKQELLDSFGRLVIGFRDRSLKIAMNYATGDSVNPIKAKKYAVLKNLSPSERNAINQLLEETVTDVIYNFLEMFEEHDNEMKLLLLKNKQEYDMVEISEKMGSEIARPDNDGWISKFSSLGYLEECEI